MSDAPGASEVSGRRRDVASHRPGGPPDRPIETWSDGELERLVTGHGPTAPPEIHAMNRVIGAADEAGRLVAAAAIVLGVLLGLALTVSPWFWIGVAVCAACIVATVVWLVRRRRRGAPRSIAARTSPR